MSRRYANAALMLFCGVVVAVLIYIFYASPLRARIESKLFDVRTRLAPTVANVDQVALVTIDDESIAKLEPDAKAEKDKPVDLSYDRLVGLVEQIMESEARDIVVFLPSQVFSYESPKLAEIAALAKRDPRILLAVFDINPESGTTVIPDALKEVSPVLVRGDIPRDYRRSVIRDFVIERKDSLPFLAAELARRHDPQMLARATRTKKDGEAKLKLNYFDLGLLSKVPAENIEAEKVKLKGRTVFLGYTTFRPWSLQAAESTFANSPWQLEGDDVQQGVPLISLQSVAFLNLVEDRWLKISPSFTNVLQTLIILVATIAIWNLSTGFATFIFMGGWCLILIIHAAFFAFGRLYIPIADTLLFSCIAMVIGSIWKLRQEGKMRAAHEARVAAEAELAAIQERFLSQFAFELSAINEGIRARLSDLPFANHEKDAVRTAYSRILGSCDELGDYLVGIKQFATLQGKGARATALVRTDVRSVIDSVVRQFDARREEASLRFDLSEVSDCQVLCDKTVLTQILYNLVSNAVKYSHPSSTVFLSARPKGNEVTITVRDEGPGIALEFHERIFEKFYRIKDDQVYKIKGHGLGLYLSRYFAETVNAKLTVESTLGKGASFILRLRGTEG